MCSYFHSPFWTEQCTAYYLQVFGELSQTEGWIWFIVECTEILRTILVVRIQGDAFNNSINNECETEVVVNGIVPWIEASYVCGCFFGDGDFQEALWNLWQCAGVGGGWFNSLDDGKNG